MNWSMSPAAEIMALVLNLGDELCDARNREGFVFLVYEGATG